MNELQKSANWLLKATVDIDTAVKYLNQFLEGYDSLSSSGDLDVRFLGKQDPTSTGELSVTQTSGESGKRSQETGKEPEQELYIDLSDAITEFDEVDDTPLPQRK